MLAIALTVPKSALRHPSLWLLWSGVLLWLFLSLELPELAASSGPAPDAMAAALLLAAWWGTTLAIADLAADEWILGQLAPAARGWTELLAVGCTGFLALLPVAALIATQASLPSLAGMVAALAPLLVKGAAAATLVLRIPLGGAYKVWVYVLVSWLLPSMGLGRILGWPLEVEALVRGRMLGQGAVLADMAAAAGLGLGTWMILKTQGGRRCATES